MANFLDYFTQFGQNLIHPTTPYNAEDKSRGLFQQFYDDPLGTAMAPLGSGDNAKSLAQMGLEGYGILQMKDAFGKQLDLARNQLNYQKDLTRGNFLNNGANYLNQGLFQLEALNAFNPQAGAERAQNFGAAVNTMNQAGAKIGLGNNAFAEQKNAIAKYNTLAR